VTFEVRRWDGAGRIGELAVPRSGTTVTTPALLPVINPHMKTLSAATLEADFDAQILITNAYIVHGSDEVREPAVADGLHDLLAFDGAIMTDSGSFQLSEYGEIDVTTEEIIAFQHDIGTDIATPVDVPTPPDVGREQTSEELATTLDRLDTAAAMDTGDMLLSAPVQGGTYPDLRERAGRAAYRDAFDVYPVGGVVPLLNDYRYAEVVDATRGAKRGLGLDAPVHLFGAGHPMTFALAVACGCDLFDSAAYALYARDGRYLTVSGTRQLDDIVTFPCSCPVCTDHTPDELRTAPSDRQEELLARHNLHVSYAEVRRIREAIRAGDLFELVEQRARAHPALLDGYRTLLDHADELERTDPTSKGTYFYVSAESTRRPEVGRHHDRLARLDAPDDLLVTTAGGTTDDHDAAWRLVPPFGPVPSDLAETYPVNAERPTKTDRTAMQTAMDGVARLAASHPETTLTVAHHGWPAATLAELPDRVSTIDLTENTQ
jgi:7-cyano-7-deazaguanine tRNA-ribosyltransferase